MAVDPDRRAALSALGSLGTLFAGGCLGVRKEPPVPPEALEARFTDVGATESDDLRASVAVRNPTERAVEATLYVQAVVPNATHTAARYLELEPTERVTRTIEFPASYDRFFDGGWLRVELTTGGA